MKNYKLDIKEMAEACNNVNYTIDGYNCSIKDMDCYISQEQMSDMVQKHAEKLGYGKIVNNLGDCTYCYLDSSGSIGGHFELNYFNKHRNKKIGLEFFNIKPDEYFNVRMPKSTYKTIERDINFAHSEIKEKLQFDKWELLK